MAVNENIVEGTEILAIMLRRFMIDFPYKSSKEKIKELYSSWVYSKASVAAPHEHADMLIFTDQLKDLLRQANKVLKEK